MSKVPTISSRDIKPFAGALRSSRRGNAKGSASVTGAVCRNVGGIYVTDDVMNNPWDTLPSYWQQEVDAVAQINAQLSAGDFNGDGVVDLADLDDPTLGWKARFGSDLGGGDFLDWQRRYTAPAGGAAIGLVPEPPTGCLGAVALIAASLGVTRIPCNPSTTKRKSAANGSS